MNRIEFKNVIEKAFDNSITIEELPLKEKLMLFKWKEEEYKKIFKNE